MTGKEKILDVLKDGQWHTYLDLLKVYYKFQARIYDLEKDGHVIERRVNQYNKHASDYRLVVLRQPHKQSSLFESKNTQHGILNEKKESFETLEREGVENFQSIHKNKGRRFNGVRQMRDVRYEKALEINASWAFRGR